MKKKKVKKKAKNYRMIAEKFSLIAESGILEKNEIGSERVEAIVAMLDYEMTGGACRLASIIPDLACDVRVGEIA